MDFGRGPTHLVTMGWGDVSTAYHSTGIPNVTVYMGFPAAMVSMMRLTRFVGPLLYTRTARDFIKWLHRKILCAWSFAQAKSKWIQFADRRSDRRQKHCARKITDTRSILPDLAHGCGNHETYFGRQLQSGFPNPEQSLRRRFYFGIHRSNARRPIILIQTLSVPLPTKPAFQPFRGGLPILP